MEQQQKVIDLFIEGYTFEEIQDILNEEWGAHSLKSRTIYKWIQLAKCGTIEAVDTRGGDRRSDEEIDNRILQILDKFPFASVRMIAQMLNIWPSRAHARLQHIGLIYRLSKWIPHDLTIAQKQKRVDEGKKLLQFLRRMKQNNWRGLITGDESWFQYAYGNQGKWCAPEEESIIEVSNEKSWGKIFVIIFWSVYGFHVVDGLDCGTTLNSALFCDTFLTKLLAEKHIFCDEKSQNQFYIHLDNCRVHNSKLTKEFFESNGMISVPHPPYSPDLAPSDFYLFGYVKNKLQGKIYTRKDALLDAIREIVNEIPKKTLEKVFDSWISRCETVISSGGSYFLKD